MFTNIEEVRKEISTSIFIPVGINTDFYSSAEKSIDGKLHLTFAAHRAVRKGFPLLTQVFNQLDDQFHLNIIGDWQNDLHLLTNTNYSFYGALPPERLKQVYEHSHVFIYTGTQDRYALDGFPTTAAADAMSTGCLLVSTNPRRDRFTLEAGIDFLEIDANVPSIMDTLNWITENRPQAMEIAKKGSASIRHHFDCKTVVKNKLSHIFSP
ncbi:glycosyltransferase [Rossellomorea sp. AcN35-11]|nr:glycosyltransferase [Rossellomorea sp. AcN35-11]